jgi:hypothetical protein
MSQRYLKSILHCLADLAISASPLHGGRAVVSLAFMLFTYEMAPVFRHFIFFLNECVRMKIGFLRIANGIPAGNKKHGNA